MIKEADSWYISLVLEDPTVPNIEVAGIQPTEKNSIGIDLGLEFYAALSTEETIENPRFLRKTSLRLAKLQQKLSQRKKFSKPWQIIKRKIAKLHQKIKRQRLDFQFKTAYQLFEKCDVLIVEDLTLKNLIRRNKPKIENGLYVPNNQAQKSGLNHSLCDAAHGQFVKVLEFIAWKLGKSITFVDPKGTSQHCNSCLSKVPKNLSDRWHECTCGTSIARDINSAKLIKRLGTEGTDIASLKNAQSQLASRSSRSVV